MERRACADGHRWDSLIKRCILHESLRQTPSAASPSVLSTRGLDESWSISPSVWICVGLVVGGSVLVLLLWFIIYRRHSRTSQSTGEKDSTPHTPSTIEQEEEALSPLPHVNGLTQETPINEGPCGRSLCEGRSLCNGRSQCNGWAEHGLPLPATELGDSALVTAKTGQLV